MYGGACALLDCAYGTFDFAYVIVRRGYIHAYGQDVAPDALEFLVGVQVGDNETSCSVEVNDVLE